MTRLRQPECPTGFARRDGLQDLSPGGCSATTLPGSSNCRFLFASVRSSSAGFRLICWSWGRAAARWRKLCLRLALRRP